MRDYRRCSGSRDARDRQETRLISASSKVMHVGNPLPRKLASSRKSRQFVFLYSHVYNKVHTCILGYSALYFCCCLLSLNITTCILLRCTHVHTCISHRTQLATCFKYHSRPRRAMRAYAHKRTRTDLRYIGGI
jgi:hypothetical protein